MDILRVMSRTVLLGLILAAAAFAQTGQITGRVTDASGSVIPGSSIVVTSTATAIERRTESNDAGYYNVSLLKPGGYSLRVEQQGFKTAARAGVTIEVDQRVELNFTLEVGNVSERIEVTARATQLNTVEASRGQVIDNQRIVDLPLNGRNYNDLALLSPGASQPARGGRFGGFSSGGMRATQNNFLLDGMDNNPYELASAQRRSEMVQPSIDAIQEFKVQTNAYSAEYGRSMGSVVNVTTKSGTNQLHGSAFEFLRNEKLDAKNFFDPANRAKPPFKRNQYGFSVGGPVIIPKLLNGRNRIFFFGDYEGAKVRESATNTSTIATTRMRTGDFGDLFAERGRVIRDPDNNAPFPGNTIPAARIDPLARTLVNLYPTPQNASVAANYLHLAPRLQDVHKWDARIDTNIGSRDNVFWRLSQHNSDNPATLSLPAPAYGGNFFDSIVEGINTGANWNHVWTPNLISSVRGSWGLALFKRDNPKETNGELLNQKYGIRGGNNTIPGGFASMGITGYAPIGIGGFNPVDRDSQNRQFAADFTWTKAKHTLKFGTNFLRSQNNIFNIRTELGGYSFNGQFTNDGMADFLLGLANNYSWNTRLQVDLRSLSHGYFVQDDWKVSPRLTVNLGARYEVVLPYVDKRDRMGIFDISSNPDSPRLIYAGAEGKDRFNRAMFATDTNNFMPRVGFAYKINDKTVLRSGYGIFYTTFEPFGDAEYLIGNPPNAYGVSFAASATAPALLLRNGPAEGSLTLARASGLQFVSYERHADIGYAQQWNFNIQRELGKDWMLETGYSASKGTHLMQRYDDNFSPPGPGNLNAKRRYQRAEIPGTGIVTSPLGPVQGYHNNGNSTYHALVSSLEKRFSAGYTILLSYSWSKAIGDTCGGGGGDSAGCGFQDLRNISLEKGALNEDVPHRMVLSSLYDLPLGKGRKWASGMHPVLQTAFGGWSVGSIVTAASGLPFNLTVSGNPANSGSITVVNRPNVVGDWRQGTRTVNSDFNVAAFVSNRQFETGNMGRNAIRERPQFNWNFSALKDFRLREALRLQFRFEAFQFTNTPRFNVPGAVLGTATYGRITGADTPRNLQFGAKLVW